MRGSDERTGELFSYVDIEERVPQNHPLRLIRNRPIALSITHKWIAGDFGSQLDVGEAS